jgi:hypothetical protein
VLPAPALTSASPFTEERGWLSRACIADVLGQIVASLGAEAEAVRAAIEPYRGGMGDKAAEGQSREDYLATRKAMVSWLKAKVDIDINVGHLGGRIAKWAKVASLLTKMSTGPIIPVSETVKGEL